MNFLPFIAFLFWFFSRQGTEDNDTFCLRKNIVSMVSRRKRLLGKLMSGLSTTVRLTRNDKLIAMGGIVDSRGYALTKASDCVGLGKLKPRWKEYRLKIKKRDEKTDLPYTKCIGGTVFPALQWSDANSTQRVRGFCLLFHAQRIRPALQVAPSQIGRKEENGTLGGGRPLEGCAFRGCAPCRRSKAASLKGVIPKSTEDG